MQYLYYTALGFFTLQVQKFWQVTRLFNSDNELAKSLLVHVLPYKRVDVLSLSDATKYQNLCA